MRQKLWIIPLTIFIMLTVAWFFRWDKGPTTTQSKPNIKIVYTKDNWTGQPWMTLYGKLSNNLYGEETEPVLSPSQIEEKENQILSSPDMLKQKQNLENDLSKYKNIENQNEEGHTQYVQIVCQNMTNNTIDYYKVHPTSYQKLLESEGITPDFSDYGGAFDLDQYNLKVGNDERQEKYEQGVPAETITAQVAWFNAKDQYNEANSKLNNLPKNAENTARSQLKAQDQKTSNIVTWIWVILLAASFVSTILLLLFSGRKTNIKTEAPA